MCVQGWNWLAECFAPYSAADYASLVDGPPRSAFVYKLPPAALQLPSRADVSADGRTTHMKKVAHMTDYSVRAG